MFTLTYATKHFHQCTRIFIFSAHSCKTRPGSFDHKIIIFNFFPRFKTNIISAAGQRLNCAFYGKSMTFSTVILHTQKRNFKIGTHLEGHLWWPWWRFLILPSVDRVFIYWGCRVAFYRINYISLSLSNCHNILYNKIRHVTTSNMAVKIKKMVAK